MPFKPFYAVLAATLALAAWSVSAGPAPKPQAVPAKTAAAPAATAPVGAALADSAAPATEATKVLLAKSGSRYHLKGCKYLKSGAGKEITIGEAMRKGYAPCNACKAPRVQR